MNIGLFTFTEQQRADVTAFVEQADSGLAPIVHRAWHLHQGSVHTVARELQGDLMDQVTRRNCDAVVMGRVDGRRTGTGAQVVLRPQARALRGRGLDRAPRRALPLPRAGGPRPGGRRGDGPPRRYGRTVRRRLRRDDLFNADELAIGTDPYEADSDGDATRTATRRRTVVTRTDPNVGSNDTTPPTVDELRVTYTTTRVAKGPVRLGGPVTWVADYVVDGTPRQVRGVLPGEEPQPSSCATCSRARPSPST